MANGTEPIADDELLFRRVPSLLPWYDAVKKSLRPEAFRPNKDRDLTGISVWREKYKAIEDAARGRPGKSYYIAVLRAGDLRQRGFLINPRPLPDDPGHAELPELNATNAKDSMTLERERLLASLCVRLEGPFETPLVN